MWTILQKYFFCQNDVELPDATESNFREPFQNLNNHWLFNLSQNNWGLSKARADVEIKHVFLDRGEYVSARISLKKILYLEHKRGTLKKLFAAGTRQILKKTHIAKKLLRNQVYTFGTQMRNIEIILVLQTSQIRTNLVRTIIMVLPTNQIDHMSHINKTHSNSLVAMRTNCQYALYMFLEKSFNKAEKQWEWVDNRNLTDLNGFLARILYISWNKF